MLGPSQVAGRIIIKVFLSRMSMGTIGIFTATVFPIVFAAVFFLPSSFVALIPVAIAYGAAKGIMTIVKGMAVPEFLTKNAYGAINGAMNLPITSLRAFAPTIAALSWSVTQDYNLLLISLIGVSLLAVVALFVASILREDSTK